MGIALIVKSMEPMWVRTRGIKLCLEVTKYIIRYGYYYSSFVNILGMGASIVKWTKKVLRYTKAMIFLVKCL